MADTDTPTRKDVAMTTTDFALAGFGADTYRANGVVFTAEAVRAIGTTAADVVWASTALVIDGTAFVPVRRPAMPLVVLG